MRLLVIAAVAALTGIIMTFVMKEFDGPWNADSSIRSGIVGAVSALVAVGVGRSIRRKD